MFGVDIKNWLFLLGLLIGFYFVFGFYGLYVGGYMSGLILGVKSDNKFVKYLGWGLVWWGNLYILYMVFSWFW